MCRKMSETTGTEVVPAALRGLYEVRRLTPIEKSTVI